MKTTRTHSSSGSNVQGNPKMPNPPTLIEHKNLRFLIFDAPSERNIDLYSKELVTTRVSDVVRVCEPTYDKKTFESLGIRVHDWPFPDGDPPPSNVVQSWLDLVNARFYSKDTKNGSGNTNSLSNPAPLSTTSTGNEPTCIGVHCVAGLGRFDFNFIPPSINGLN